MFGFNIGINFGVYIDVDVNVGVDVNVCDVGVYVDLGVDDHVDINVCRFRPLCSYSFKFCRRNCHRCWRWLRHGTLVSPFGIDVDLDVDLDINIDIGIEVGVKVNVCDVSVNVNFYFGNVGIEFDSNDSVAKGIVGVQLKFVSLYDLAIALIGLNFGIECAFICPWVLTNQT